jgi:hypothetical protein
MTTNMESLIVELDAKVDGYIKGQQKARNENEKTEASLDKLNKKAKLFGAAAVAAFSAAAVEAANFAKELSIAANRAGESVEEMQRLAFATKTVGIDLEKLGDIAKDTNEKVGEFIATGGGGFQDFADVMGLTKETAQATAREFEQLSGPQVLQRMVIMMEEANISAERMSFALEGMASDSTDLIPLLRNSGQEIDNLKRSFDDLNVALSEFDVEALEEVQTKMDELTASVTGDMRQLVADSSELILTFLTIAQSVSSTALDSASVIAAGWSGIVEMAKAAISDIIDGTDSLPTAIERATERSEQAMQRLLENFEGGESPLEILITKGSDQLTDESPFIQRLAMEAKLLEDIEALKLTGMETEAERIQKEHALLESMYEQKPLNEKQYQEARVQIGVNASKRILATEDEQAKATKKSEGDKLNSRQTALRAGMAVANAFFEENKAINAGLIIAETATGIQKSLAINPYDWANPALIAATGAVNLANALGATKGGGSISGGGGGGGAAIVNQPSDFQQETSSLELTEQTVGEGSNTVRVVIGTDDGNNLIDTIGQQLEVARSEGRVG